jgi:hypothetical protein
MTPITTSMPFITAPTPFIVITILQIILAVGLINVWLVRFKKSTAYRGGSAQTLSDEFAVYGLPKWFMYIVGSLKIIIAIVLLVSAITPIFFWFAVYALGVLVVLMIGAVAMHIKVRDPLMKALPALAMLGMAIAALAMYLF